jgi:hypothetical protein
MREWLLTRFCDSKDVVVKVPVAWTDLWERDLAGLEKAWKQANRGGKIPKIRMAMSKQLQALVQEENVSV